MFVKFQSLRCRVYAAIEFEIQICRTFENSIITTEDSLYSVSVNVFLFRYPFSVKPIFVQKILKFN